MLGRDTEKLRGILDSSPNFIDANDEPFVLLADSGKNFDNLHGELIIVQRRALYVCSFVC